MGRTRATATGGAGETVRRLVLALVIAGMAGLTAELLLLEHYEDLWQWLPLAVLAAGLAAGLALAARPAPATVRAFQGVMGAFVLAGVVGLVLHFRGNAEFEREMDSALAGFTLAWRSLHGATPALAPGAMVQLGLLGLACAYGHPALGRPTDHTPEKR